MVSVFEIYVELVLMCALCYRLYHLIKYICDKIIDVKGTLV